MKTTILFLVLALIGCGKSQDPTPTSVINLIGYWEFVQLYVEDGQDSSHTHLKGCDFTDVPVKFENSVFEFSLFVTKEEATVVLCDDPGTPILFVWNIVDKTKTMRLIDKYGTAYMFAIESYDGINMKMRLTNFKFQPVVTFKRK